VASDFGKRFGPSDFGRLAARTREHIEGQPCTPRCADMHALDCPNYRGPLSTTGSLANRDPREIAREGDW
jgi:hypothetical protein